MFTKKDIDDNSPIEEAIDNVFSQMESYDADSAEYSKLLTSLERLHALKPEKKGMSVSGDAVMAVAGNLVGIVAILSYERVHVVTSKALSFVLKTKV